MLRILGSRKRLCDGVSRREMLRAGGLSLFGLHFADLLKLRGSQAPSIPSRSPSFGKAKNCILLYLYGAPSQLETFDLKPDSPSDVRGDFKPRPTSVTGLSICEHLPRTAAIMRHTALIRSMTHPYNIHSAAYALTGTPTTDIPMELNPRDARHWPFFGSVLDYLDARKHGRRRSVPFSVGLPFKFSAVSPFKRGGPYGAFLGSGYDPLWGDVVAKASHGDPYRGIEFPCRVQLGESRGPDVTLDRLSGRRTLLDQLERQLGGIAATAEGRGFDRHQQMAFDLIASPRMRQALDLEREPVALRERYGKTLFGQSVLAARRLIEHGVKLATVFWDEYQEANSAWDTHVQQYPRLKDELLPGFDAAYPTLLEDLLNRGLLDETLVVCMSEHGRTPKLSKAAGGGREHWSWAYPCLLAGAGLKRGVVLGATDKIAGFPKDRPVSPKDVLCTIYHLLGVDPRTQIMAREGRPVPLVPEGNVLTELLA